VIDGLADSDRAPPSCAEGSRGARLDQDGSGSPVAHHDWSLRCVHRALVIDSGVACEAINGAVAVLSRLVRHRRIDRSPRPTPPAAADQYTRTAEPPSIRGSCARRV